MIGYIEEYLDEIESIRREIQKAHDARDYERLFCLTVCLESAVHRLNHGE